MKRTWPVLLLLSACAPAQYVQKGVQDGVEFAYRWNHPPGKPSELLLKLVNTANEDKQVDLVIDVHYQGRTVEVLEADTCIRAGQTLNGKLNGIYFIPTKITTEQIKAGDAEAEITRSVVAPSHCP